MNKTQTLIRICNGPGCNAWDAQEILRGLPETIKHFGTNFKICESACMNKCGGGVTVEVNGNSDCPIKVRKPIQALDKILSVITPPIGV